MPLISGISPHKKAITRGMKSRNPSWLHMPVLGKEGLVSQAFISFKLLVDQEGILCFLQHQSVPEQKIPWLIVKFRVLSQNLLVCDTKRRIVAAVLAAVSCEWSSLFYNYLVTLSSVFRMPARSLLHSDLDQPDEFIPMWQVSHTKW